MLILGQSGEADGLTDAETREVLTLAIGAAADEKVIIAGVGRESVAATLSLAEIAAAAGYDAIAVRPPEFAGDPSMRAELATYFKVVADRSALPVVLLSERGRPLAIEVAGELAWHPQVIGFVDAELSPERLAGLQALTSGVGREVAVTTVFAAATGRMLRESEAEGSGNFVSLLSLGGVAAGAPAAAPRLKTRFKRVGFQVLAGSSRAMLEAWNGGAMGAVPRLGACAPQACCEVWQAFRDGDPALAEEKQMRIRAAGERMEGWAGIAALKYGCDLNGYFGGRPRLPLLLLTATERQAVEDALGGLKN